MTGKYNAGIPEESRYNTSQMWRKTFYSKYSGKPELKEKNVKIINGMKEIAEELKCSYA